MNDTAAKYQTGDRLHFRPSPTRAPFGTVIPEGDVTVTEVVDHGSATAYSPRFTYVVAAADGETQGTDDRELSYVIVEIIREAVDGPDDAASDETINLIEDMMRETSPTLDHLTRAQIIELAEDCALDLCGPTPTPYICATKDGRDFHVANADDPDTCADCGEVREAFYTHFVWKINYSATIN